MTCGYCETDITPHEVNQCEEEIASGISALGFIFCPVITDRSDTTQWESAIAAGDAMIMKEIRATYPAASPIEGKNRVFCGPDTVVKGWNHTVSVEDFNVSGNNDTSWGTLNGRKFELVLFYCNDQTIRYTDSDDVRIAGTNPISGESTNDSQFYQGTASWTARASSIGTTLANAPVGIFE